jgi:hypothetical protein
MAPRTSLHASEHVRPCSFIAARLRSPLSDTAAMFGLGLRSRLRASQTSMGRRLAPRDDRCSTTVADTSLVVEDEQARLHQAELTRLQIALGLRQGVKEDCMMVDIDALLFIS